MSVGDHAYHDPTLVPLMSPLGIDAYINPRATTVSSILRHIRHGRVRNVYSIGDAEAEIIEAEVLSTSPIAGCKVRDIDFPEGVLIGSIRKGDKIVKPTGGTRIEEGDVIAVLPFGGCARSGAPVSGLHRLFLSALMIASLSRLPLFLLLFGLSGVAMYVPAIYAGVFARSA